jgi:hypothetical protein
LPGNLQGWTTTLDEADASMFGVALASRLDRCTLLDDVPEGALNEDPADVPDLAGLNYDGLIDALIGIADFGIANAFPKQPLAPEAASDSPESLLSLHCDSHHSTGSADPRTGCGTRG